MEKLRILVGTVEIAGQIPVLTDAFRRLGHQVTSVIACRHPLYPDIHYDVDISGKAIRWPDTLARTRSLLVRLPRGLVNRAYAKMQRARRLRLIHSHDLFVFQWAGTSLWPGNREYPLLKKSGKLIISFFNGDDVRHASAYSQQYNISLQGLDDFYRNDPLERPLRNLRAAERYSDLIISQPNQSGLAVRPYYHFFVPMSLSLFRGNIPARDVPVVIHAPSSKPVKGTELIMEALNRLHSDGVSFEMRLLHQVPNFEVIAALRDADVVIDQLYSATYGKLGLEAMASGCAVASRNREDCDPIPPNRPIWHISPENLYDQLKRLLTDKVLRVRLAREGLQYVNRYHDHVNVARRIIAFLKNQELQPCDYYPSFFTRKYSLPPGVVISDDLRQMTAQIVQRWGLPEDVDPCDLVRRGLISADALDVSKAIPRWKPTPALS